MQFILILGVIVVCALYRAWVWRQTYRECRGGAKEGIDIVPILTIRARSDEGVAQEATEAMTGGAFVKEYTR